MMRPLVRVLVSVPLVALGVGVVALPAMADAPIASNDAYGTPEDQALVVPVDQGVLANDTDADGVPVAQLVDDVGHGTLSLADDGSFTYTPAQDFDGPDSFTYQAFDGPDGSDVATVTLTVDPVNDPPVAVDDVAGTDQDVQLVVPAPGVLGNDTDVDDDVATLAAHLDDPPTHGSLSFKADGSFTYVPNAGFHGTETFTYHATDPSLAASDPATVTLTVSAPESPPVAVDDEVTTPEDTPVVIAVLDNDSDPDAEETLTVDQVGAPGPGATAQANGDGTVTYTPPQDFDGDDGFDYSIDDGHGGQSTAHVTVHVTPVDDAPDGTPDEYTFSTPSLSVASEEGLLENDTDVEGDNLTAVLETPPATGMLELNGDGSFTYTPASSVCQRDVTFTYRADDGTEQSPPVTVTLHVEIPPTSTTVTLARSTAVVGYHGSVTVLAHVSAYTPGAQLTITRRPFAAAPITLITHAPNGDGDLSFTVPSLAKRNTFQATSSLDNCYLPAASAAVPVQVRAGVTPALTRWYRISGGIRLFHMGTDPLFRATVAPPHPGDNVRWIWQRKVGAVWRNYLTPTVGTEASAAGFFLQGAVKGTTYRIRAIGPYDTDGTTVADNLPGSSRWIVFRVTR